MEVEEIDYFLLHQANDRMLEKMSKKKLGVSREKIPANMMEYGNTSAASIPFYYQECVENHQSRWMEVKKFFHRIRWRFVGHFLLQSYLNMETHFKKFIYYF